MSAMKFPHRLERDGAWFEVDVVDTTLTTRSGKGGGKPRITEKKLRSVTEAQTAAYTKIVEQLKKGCSSSTGNGTRPCTSRSRASPATPCPTRVTACSSE